MNRQGCIVWRENPRYVTLYIGTNKHADPRISYIEIGAALLRSMKARIYHRVLFHVGVHGGIDTDRGPRATQRRT